MSFARKVWHFLVAVKDGLSLVFLLLFFLLLYAVLTARPSPVPVRDGALLLRLNGAVVEEKSRIDPLAVLMSDSAPAREFQARDLVRAIDAAAGDARIKAIVLDLSEFTGGGQAHLQDIGEALGRARAANKPVLAWAVAYADDGLALAAHASEIWVDPLGGAMIAGPGGSHLYYGGLLDRLKINARVYKVGTYKSAVEPYTRSDMSPEARENYTALYGALWEEWQANFRKVRPQADLARVIGQPAEWVASAQGDLATAGLSAGLVDKIGTKVDFGRRVARLVGDDEWDNAPGAFAHTELDPWLADTQPSAIGDKVGVVTIAGTIVDGDAGPGTAGGERIAKLLDDALDDDLKALVVRVDSPGGSALASEQIRLAILRHKRTGIPVAVSMGNVAASGGYWVATPGQRIFAEPETITGSIGIFAVVPTFERLAAEWGVNADGVRTTPLSGQPDLVGGFTPEVDAMLQSLIANGYQDFLGRVAYSRKMSAAQVDAIGQGRVWDGGAARQIGLVDQYGDLDDAIAWAAAQAKLDKDGYAVTYLGDGLPTFDSLLENLVMRDSSENAGARDLFALVAGREQAALERLADDVRLVFSRRGVQAYCLECPMPPQPGKVNAPQDALTIFKRLWLD